MLIIFDIDGTLADLTHRRRFVTCRPKNWPAFNAGMRQDAPIAEIIAVLHAMRRAGHTIVIATGREGSEKNRQATREWLEEHLDLSVTFAQHDAHAIPISRVRSIPVYIRKARDYRTDDLVKEDILHDIIADFGKKPDLVFDDRKRVVDMWRRNGIRVAQVDEGDF